MYTTEEIPSYDTVRQDLLDIVISYENDEYKTEDDFINAHKKLVILNYYLTEYNITFHTEHAAVIANDESGITAARIKADEEVPMYKDTHSRLKAVNNIMWSLKNQLELIKETNKKQR